MKKNYLYKKILLAGFSLSTLASVPIGLLSQNIVNNKSNQIIENSNKSSKLANLDLNSQKRQKAAEILSANQKFAIDFWNSFSNGILSINDKTTMNDGKHKNFKELLKNNNFIDAFVNSIWKEFLKGYCIYEKTGNYDMGNDFIKEIKFFDKFVNRKDKYELYKNLTGVPFSHENGTNNSFEMLDDEYENSVFYNNPFTLPTNKKGSSLKKNIFGLTIMDSSKKENYRWFVRWNDDENFKPEFNVTFDEKGNPKIKLLSKRSLIIQNMYLDEDENDIKYDPNQSEPYNPYDGWINVFYNNEPIEFNIPTMVLDNYFKPYWNSDKLFEYMDKNFGKDWFTTGDNNNGSGGDNNNGSGGDNNNGSGGDNNNGSGGDNNNGSGGDNNNGSGGDNNNGSGGDNNNGSGGDNNNGSGGDNNNGSGGDNNNGSGGDNNNGSGGDNNDNNLLPPIDSNQSSNLHDYQINSRDLLIIFPIIMISVCVVIIMTIWKCKGKK